MKKNKLIIFLKKYVGLSEDAFSRELLHERRTTEAWGRGGNEAEDAEAIVKIDVDGAEFHTVASGDGPVNALDQALRKGLEQKFPSLMQVHLEDYKVRVLTSGDGTAAKVRVLIESSDGRDVWGTVGVSENVIEASWIALADSLHYKLLKDALEAAGEGQTVTG